MREIEFRGKTESGEWVFGSLIQMLLSDISRDETRIKTQYLALDYDVIPDTVGQYTGLKDKNGVKIFEGDIVTVYDKYNQVWAEGGAEIVFSYDYVGGWVLLPKDNKRGLNIGTRAKSIKVIGNIHDNPELLEGN